MTTDCIFIERFKVSARVGIYPREKLIPQLLELDLSFGFPPVAAMMDDIQSTISYAEVVAVIQKELGDQTRHFNLLESLGNYILDLLITRFQASWAKVSIVKIGVMKNVGRVGVRMERVAQKQDPGL